RLQIRLIDVVRDLVLEVHALKSLLVAEGLCFGSPKLTGGALSPSNRTSFPRKRPARSRIPSVWNNLASFIAPTLLTSGFPSSNAARMPSICHSSTGGSGSCAGATPGQYKPAPITKVQKTIRCMRPHLRSGDETGDRQRGPRNRIDIPRKLGGPR